MGPSLAGKSIPQTHWDAERDKKIHERVKELLETNAEVKAIASRNPYLAWRKALAMAAIEIPPKGGGFGSGPADVARSQGDDKIPDKKWIPKDSPLRNSRDDAVHELTLKLLASDPECVRLFRTDEYKAFKLASRKAMAAGAAAATPMTLKPAGAQDAALTRPVLERARLVHKGAMILLRTDPTYQALALRNYPDAFDKAHSSADGERREQLCIPLKMETNALKPGSREERVYQRALLTLKTALKDRDAHDSLGAFDEAIRDAEVTTPLDGQPPSTLKVNMADRPLPPLQVRFPAVLQPGAPRMYDRRGQRLPV